MKVCILGSGLASLTLAKALVNKKIFVDIITSKIIPKTNKSRTIGISKSNIDFFNDSILNLKNIAWELKKIDIFSENLKNEKLIHFKNNDDQLFSIIQNYKLYDLLEKNLKINAYFKRIIFRNKKNFFDKYNLIFNTDYCNSITKKYFNKKIVKKYNSFAHTCIINHEKIINDTAVQIFTKRGPLAFLPVSNKETSVVYSLDNSKIKNNIKDLIQEYNFKYDIKKIDKLESIELKSLSLRSYYFKNFLAFGDLLHRIHPLAGQGFNMTIRDIKIILQIIDYRQSLGLPLDSSINKEFEKKIRHKNFIFANGVDLIHEFFNFERKIKSNIFTKSVQVIGKNPTLNKIFTNFADKGLSP